MPTVARRPIDDRSYNDANDRDERQGNARRPKARFRLSHDAPAAVAAPTSAAG
jgi:hypothetical protein